MKYMVIKYIICIFIFISFVYSQSKPKSPDKKDNVKISIIKINKDDKQPHTGKNEKKIINNNWSIINRVNYKSPEKPALNIPFPKTIASAFNNNFQFTGFYDKCAVIDIKPQMTIKPFGFISFYANHISSMYIPLNEIKDYIKPVVLIGAAIYAIDNTFNSLFTSYPLIQSLAGFAVKNFIVTFLKRTFAGERIAEFKSYYYAVSIRF